MSQNARSGVAVFGEPMPRTAESGVIAMPMPTRELVIVAVQCSEERFERGLAGDCLSEPDSQCLWLDGCDEALHVAIRGSRTLPAGGKPSAGVVGIEVLGSLPEVEEFARPHGTRVDVDVRLATR